MSVCISLRSDYDGGELRRLAKRWRDPRWKICCQEEPDAMTTPCAPKVGNGTMIIFPGTLVHFVDAYTEPGTRITLSWNVNQAAIPGTPPD